MPLEWNSQNSRSKLQESARRRLILSIEIIYWLLLFEGVLRKWLLVPFAKPLYFIRDPFYLYCYWVAFRAGLYPSNIIAKSTLAVCGVYALLALLQAGVGTTSILASLYGWKLYLFYAPLACIIGSIFPKRNLRRLIKITLIISIPMALLVFWQYRSPPNSFINRMVDTDQQFTYGNLARTSGVFASAGAMESFCHILFCFIVFTWLLNSKQRPLSGPWLILASTATMIAIILGGNRGVFFSMAETLVLSLIFRLLISKARLSFRLFMPELLCVGSFVALTVLFPDAYSALEQRFSEQNTDGYTSRIGSEFAGAFTGVLNTSIWGTGLGVSNGGAKALMLGIHSKQAICGDFETSKVVMEAGVLGVIYIGCRWILAIYLIVASYRASKMSNNPVPLVLCSFPVLQLLIGAISYSSVGSCFAWLFVGFSLAANQTTSDYPRQQ